MSADPLFAKNNAIYAAKVAKNLPANTLQDVQLRTNQAAHVGLNAIFNKLAANDQVIQHYLANLSSTYVNVEEEKIQEIGQCPLPDDTLYREMYSKALTEHIQQYHINNTVLAAINQSCINISCDGIDLTANRFTTGEYDYSPSISSLSAVTNDVVAQTAFNNGDGLITVAVKNHATDGEFKNYISNQEVLAGITNPSLPTLDEVPFIYKKWISGMKELVVYVPTTFTMYKDRRGPSLGQADSTIVKVSLNKGYFNFSTFYLALAAPQSLPLKITRGTSEMFTDIIQPTAMLFKGSSLGAIDETATSINMYFECSGSDAQALHIIGS